jgi:galactonate dehydratase
MMDRVSRIETFSITIPRDTPYLGALRTGEEANARGYFIRNGNRTVYATVDRTVVVRVETASGAVGWGETYGLAAPRATMALITDLLADFVVGTDPLDATVTHDRLYDMMRVRGYTGGFYLDALAAIDIALWDLAGKLTGLPLVKLLGGQRRKTIPAYLSGLPRPDLKSRIALAEEWRGRGFDAFKFASPVADDGVAAEIEGLRRALGPEARIAADLHWTHTAGQAIRLIRAMEPHGLWFAEAPVNPEDIEGLALVARSVGTTVAAGEEWRTAHDALARIARRACGILQPEMGHKGVTEFMRICGLAQAHHLEIIPHATIGIGLFLAASLHASAAASSVTCHEFQHSIFEPNRHLLTGGMECREGQYTLPEGPGLGVEPSPEALKLLEKP